MKWQAINGLLFFLLFVSLGFPSPGEAVSATAPVILSFDATAAVNTISIVPEGRQRFVTTLCDGRPCVRMIREPGETNFTWALNVASDSWFDRVGDAILTFEYIATSTQISWMCFDSAFHAFHQFTDPIFASEINLDRYHSMIPLKQIDLGNGRSRNIYRLRKVLFADRLDNCADLKFIPGRDGFVGLCRVTLKIFPVSRPIHAKPPQLLKLVNYFYQTLLDRPPTPFERELTEQGFQNRTLELHSFVSNLLKTRENLERNYYPFKTSAAARQFYRLLCRRLPSIQEANWFYSYVQTKEIDWTIRLFLEKYYAEIIETACNALLDSQQ